MTAAPVLGPIGPLHEHAIRYAAAGLEVFPVKPDKSPFLSQHQATTNLDQVVAWWRSWPNALIGHRLPEHQIILDIDPKSGGDRTWKELRLAAGMSRITTRAHLSGREDGGGHSWWQRPGPKLTIARIDAWAKERNLGHPIVDENGRQVRWTGGIDLLRREHRYTILPPSPHPDTGQPYRWPPDGRDLTTPVEALPSMLAELLVVEEPTPLEEPPREEALGDSIADWFTANHTWGQLLGRHGWQLVSGDGESDGSAWRHPTATSASSATVKHGCLFVYSPNTVFDPTAPGEPRGYTRFAAWAQLQHGGDQHAAAKAARELRDGPPAPRAHIPPPPPHEDDPEAKEAPAALAERPLLPDEFWEARPVLGHIRTAARSRMCAPDALFAATMARVAQHTDYRIVLPAVIGSHGTLNCIIGIVAASGMGKGAATSVSEELLPTHEQIGYRVREVPAGSGEGMVHAFFEKVVEQDGKRKVTVMKRAVEGVLIRCDEGQALAALAGRQGQTTMETIRQAFSGEAIGGSYASDDRKVRLRAGDYRMAMLLAVQPVHARSILNDWAGGTPQRFWWAGAHDPGAPGLDDLPDWPGPIDWTPPAWNSGESRTVRGYARGVLGLDPTVTREMREHHRKATTGELVPGRYDGHRNYVRLKLAALLAVLDGRLDIDTEDWRLAGIVIDTSDRVRASILEAIRIEEADLEAYRNARAARTASAERAAERSYDDNVTRVARVISNKLRKRHEEGHEPLARRDVHALLGKRERPWMDAALGHAEALDWLRVDEDGRFWRGGARPES